MAFLFSRHTSIPWFYYKIFSVAHQWCRMQLQVFLDHCPNLITPFKKDPLIMWTYLPHFLVSRCLLSSVCFFCSLHHPPSRKDNVRSMRIQAIDLESVQFSHSVVSDSLRPHELQHARPPCPSPTPGVHPNPYPLCRWYHPTISSSAVSFSSCPQSFWRSYMQGSKGDTDAKNRLLDSVGEDQVGWFERIVLIHVHYHM